MTDTINSAIDNLVQEKSQVSLRKFAKLLASNLFKDQLPLKKHIQAGNIKIPSTTAIFNMSSATDCSSLKLGLCKACVMDKATKKLKTVCYALKSERSYRPNVLPYRRRQEKLWKDISAEDFVFQFVLINSTKAKPYDLIRLNEAGDFHDQDCVKKADRIAKLLADHGVTVYCYTSRDDLDFSRVRNLVINGSSFTKAGIANEFAMVDDIKKRPKGYVRCIADCTKCKLCSLKGLKIAAQRH